MPRAAKRQVPSTDLLDHWRCEMTEKERPADVDIETEAMYAKHDMPLLALLAEALSQTAFKEVDMPVPRDVETDAWQAVERICWTTRDRLTAITEAHHDAPEAGAGGAAMTLTLLARMIGPMPMVELLSGPLRPGAQPA